MWLFLGLGALVLGALAAKNTAPPVPPRERRLRELDQDAMEAINTILIEMRERRCANRASVALFQHLANRAMDIYAEEGEIVPQPLREDGIADAATIARFRDVTGGVVLSCGS